MSLIFINLLWSGIALGVDLPKLLDMPVWAWIFATVCPIYPLLLSGVWYDIFKKSSPNKFVLAFAVIPSMVFGVMAFIYYPLIMIKTGFDWVNFGQILWVMVYSIQAWYLFFRFKIPKIPIATVAIYLVVKFSLDYRFDTFGYFYLEPFTNTEISILAIFCIGLSLIFCSWAFLRNRFIS